MEIIGLYPGQGSQQRGMALSLYGASEAVRHLFELASESAKTDMYTLLSEGREAQLRQNAQVAITLANRSAHIRLVEMGFRFAAHSGFSLGELSAYASGGIIDDETLFAIIARRSDLMQQMSDQVRQERGDVMMAAVIGLNFEQLTILLSEQGFTDLYAANDNAPTQVVIAGVSDSLERARKLLTAHGARRVIPLSVSGPFHTPFMAEATVPFALYLDTKHFSEPKEPVISSVDGQVVESSLTARSLLANQLAQPLRWTAVMEQLKEMNKPFGEVGHGTVLAGLCKNNTVTTPCISLGSEEAIQGAIRMKNNE
jgi:[acyl-carrier-protein] S-malonyltransferase